MAQPCETPSSGKTVEAGAVHHRLQVAHPGVEAELASVPVGQAVAAGVVAPELMLAGEPVQEVTPDRALPVVFQVVHPVGGLHQRRAAAHHGVGDPRPALRAAEADLLVQILGPLARRWRRGRGRRRRAHRLIEHGGHAGGLGEDGAGRGVLVLGVAGATEGDQLAHQAGPASLVVGIGADQLAQVRQRRRGVSRQAVGEGLEDLPMQGVHLFAQGSQPGLERRAARQVQVGQEVAAEARGCSLQVGRGGRIHAARQGGAHLAQVDAQAHLAERHALAVGHDERRLRVVQQAAQLAEAPAQGAAWVVRHVPEQFAESLATVRPAGGGEVAQKRAGLAGLGQRQDCAGPHHLQLAQHPDLEHPSLSSLRQPQV